MPKTLMMNWVKSAQKALPGARVLTVGVSFSGGRWKEDSRSTVLKKLASIPAYEWDLILMSRQTLERNPMRREIRLKLIGSDFQLQRARTLSLALGRAAKSESVFFQEQLAKVRSAGEGQLCWEDLKVDLLMHDEIHGFKNLYALPETLAGRPKFMGAGAVSNRAMDARHKGCWVRSQGGRTYGLTGTPTKNSPLELYNLLSLVTDDLERIGLPGGEDFLERYCVLEPRIVPEKGGTVRSALAMVGFKNLTELRGVLGRHLVVLGHADARLEDGSLLHVPALRTLEHTFDLHPQVLEAYQLERQAALSARAFSSGQTHLFSAFARMRKLTLDPALYSSRLGILPNERFLKAAELTREALERGGKVLLFMDMGGAGGGEQDAFEDLHEDLLEDALDGPRGEAQEAALERAQRTAAQTSYQRLLGTMVNLGIDPAIVRIATARTLPDSVSRGDLEDAYNAGEIRVIVGSTGTIGEGLNLQVGTTDLIQMDIPWDPGTLEQRLGRGARQGNDEGEVRVHLLLARGSFDALTYSTLSGKKGWMDLLFDLTLDAADACVLGNSLEELALLLSDDPVATREQLERLKVSAQQGHERAKSAALLRQIEGWDNLRVQKGRVAQRAKGRVRGPTESDKRMLEHLIRSLTRTRESLLGQAEFTPYRALLDYQGELLRHSSGLPLHQDMTLTLLREGEEQPWKVLEVQEDSHLLLSSGDERLRFEWRDRIPWTDWRPREIPEPSAA